MAATAAAVGASPISARRSSTTSVEMRRSATASESSASASCRAASRLSWFIRSNIALLCDMTAHRLAAAASAYLQSAAHQPIDWYPWGSGAFAAARDLDRPILVDIGAVWCHWCHVMDRESYEDPALAEYLNAHFICIKVDRDER